MPPDPSRSIYPYKVGGGLRFNHPTYIRRQADQQLYEALRAGEFCYVFDSRQMGKSSLRVQTMHGLQLAGVISASIDLTTLGSDVVTPDQWYRGVFVELLRKFHFSAQGDLGQWWDTLADLSPIQRLSQFVEEILLTRIADRPIVICFDEIDSVLSLRFSTDDFFAWIRSCYNQRAENPSYGRLTFALFGVATPPDLMRDKQRTPFNIGKAIKLSGFAWQEAQPLADGLVEWADRPLEVLRCILDWTGGQPFLTQKLCQLVVLAGDRIPLGREEWAVNQLVRSRVLHNWELEDDPEHLRTIRDSLLRGAHSAGRLLGLYQQILMSAEAQSGAEADGNVGTGSSGIEVDDSAEQMQLLLSGLVVRQDNQLRVRNRIYQEIFNLAWVQTQLSKLRPYSEALEAWVKSGYQDESRLLQKQSLLDAQDWAAGKRLSDLDYQFLAASQLLDRRMVQMELELAEQANRILEQSQQKANRAIRRGMLSLAALSVLAIALLGLAGVLARQAMLEKRQAILSRISAAMTTAQVMLVSERQLDALFYSLQAAVKLQQLDDSVAPLQLRQQVQTTLQESVNFVTEFNRLEGHAAGVNRLQFSPDGQWIATASEDGTVKIWGADGELLHTLVGHTGEVKSLSISNDGQTLITAGEDGLIRVWTQQGELRQTIESGQGQINDVSLSPDGTEMAIAAENGTVMMWTLGGQRLRTLRGHDGAVYGIEFSPDGTTLASASADGTMKLWGRDGTLFHTLSAHRDGARDVSFSPDGQTLASAGEDDAVRIWRRDGTLLRTLTGHTNWVYRVSFSPDGQTLASASADMTVKLWHPDQGHLLRTLTGHSDDALDVTFSPDHQTLASAGLDAMVKFWHPGQRPTSVLAGHTDWVSSATFSPDGQFIATSSLDRTARLWTQEGSLLHVLRGHTDKIYGVAFSPDGSILATAGADRTVRLWTQNGQLWRTLTGFQDWVGMVEFSADGQMLATADADKNVKLWTRDGTLLHVLMGHQDWIYDLDFSPDGQRIVTAGEDKTAIIWSREGRLLHILTGHEGQVYGASFSPDGQTLATVGADGTVKQWRSNGTLLQTFQASQLGVLGVAYSPDGRMLATGGKDTTIRLWTLEGQLRGTLNGHRQSIWSVAFSPDGETLVTASQDNTAIAWDLDAVGDLEMLIQRSCDWIGDYLSTNATVRAWDAMEGSESARLCDS